MRKETLDNSSWASDPVGIALSHDKLRKFHPNLYTASEAADFTPDGIDKKKFMLKRLEEQLAFGDSRAAVVVSVTPLLVAAYSDEFDYSIVLSYPDPLVAVYGLAPGTRLLTVNLYSQTPPLASDLAHGPASLRQYTNFIPLIAEFFSDSLRQIEIRKSQIDETEWARAVSAAREYFRQNDRQYRSGYPCNCHRPPE